MLMPEAAMHEDDRVPFRQDQIRLAGQLAVVQAIPKAGLPKVSPHSNLGCRVLCSDA